MPKNKGVRLAIGTDAHNTGHLVSMKFGVDVTRRGWLEKKDLVNARSVKDLNFKDTETFG